MVGRRRLLGRVAQTERVQVGGSGGWLFQAVPGGLEHRDGGVVKRAKNLKHDAMGDRQKQGMKGRWEK